MVIIHSFLYYFQSPWELRYEIHVYKHRIAHPSRLRWRLIFCDLCRPCHHLSSPDTRSRLFAPPSSGEQSTELSPRITDTIDQLYVEDEPAISEALEDLLPDASSVRRYFKNLFPCISWIPRYNLQWLLGDCIAGLTVGLVVVPQAMAYALLATLSPDFGLYTSFAGAATYWLFGTSKDIVIGVRTIIALPFASY